MICYIYFVKCPNCEDQNFDFFDDAKSYAMGCLQDKPIITQTEVCRNDFGECTASTDMGTVWSWENVAGVSDEEMPNAVFTKGHLGAYSEEDDQEFAALDNSLGVDEVETDFNTASKLDTVPDNFRKQVVESYDSLATNERGDYLVQAPSGDGYSVYTSHDVLKGHLNCDDDETAIMRFERGDLDEACDRKPIPEGMTIEQLVEEMEENEDTVECKGCGELFDKSECVYDNDYRGWLCYACQVGVVQHGGTLSIGEAPLEESTSLTEGVYDFPYLATNEEAKMKILDALDSRIDTSRFVRGNSIAVRYEEKDPFSYAKFKTVGMMTDFDISENGRILVTIEGKRDPIDLAVALRDASTTHNHDDASKVLSAIKEIAGDLNKACRPTRADRAAARSKANDAAVLAMLESNPEVANELRAHITRIDYEIPLLDEFPEDFYIDKEGEDVTDEAMASLEKIYKSFFENPDITFAEAARDAGIVHNRPAYKDTNQNIRGSWAAIGNITFDCKISQLSPEAQSVIYAAKVKKFDDTTVASDNTNTTSCYRLANALIKFFGDDVNFYKNTDTADAFNLDF